MTAAPSPVDWRRAEQVAVAVALRDPAPMIEVDDGWLAAEAARAEARIADVTGLRSLAGAPHCEVIDRATWVRVNLDGFRRVLDPVLERWLATVPVGGSRLNPITAVTRTLTGVELGVVLGWLSTRVLGQYDLLVGAQPTGSDVGGVTDGVVYLVGPNLGRLEQQFGFEPDDFRRWVLLHELTHRAQFTGVPWLRDHVTGLMEEVLTLVDPRPSALLDAVREGVRDLAGARRRVRDGGLAALVATPAQREAMARVGGVMSLLEGHGDVTMDRAGEGLVDGRERFGRILRARRTNANPIQRIVQRLTGMEAKLDQYAAGAAFIDAVEQAGGPALIARCWASADALPSLDEIRAPATWLARQGIG